MKKEKENFKIFFDGACYLCSTEIDHYRKKKTSTVIDYVDISSPDFKAESYGLSEDAVNLEMHVQCEDGTIHKGVDAFLEIWRRIPAYERLAWALDRKWIKPALRLGYFGFARVRPYLPKKKGVYCKSGSCEVKRK